MNELDPFWMGNDRKFADIDVPASESLTDCMDRVEPLWENKIKKELEAGHNVLVVSHATTLRAIIKHVQGEHYTFHTCHLISLSLPPTLSS